MIPVSTAGNIFGRKTFFVSTFLDKYKDPLHLCSKMYNFFTLKCIVILLFFPYNTFD